MKVVMIGDTRYHLPYVDLIPFDARQNAALGDEIKAAGEILVPIIANKAKSKGETVWVIDGAHRCIHAAALGLKAPLAKYRKFASDDDEADFVRRVNLHRRHLAPQQLEEEREKRIARIVELRELPRIGREARCQLRTGPGAGHIPYFPVCRRNQLARRAGVEFA